MVSLDVAIECGFVDGKCGKKRLTGMVSLDMAIECGFVDEKCGKKRLTGMVSLDVAKAFNTMWVSGLPYKLSP